jgi:integrase-like protein
MVYRRPARTFVLPTPRVPDGLTIAPFPSETAGQRGAGDLIPDNGIVERFHKTMLDEFYRIAFRKKIYATIDDLQADLDLWMREFNEARPHQGKWCFGKTPLQTFLDALPIAREKSLPVPDGDQPAAP